MREPGSGAWTTPALTTLDRPVMSSARRAGPCALRGYLVLANVLVVVKLVEAGVSRTAAG